MKFRDKVLMINILLLSTILGIVGFFMIDNNFKLALDTQIENAIMENNLLQSSIEYEILDLANSANLSLITNTLENAGEQVGGNMLSSSSSFYIRYRDKNVYSSDEKYNDIPESLFDDSDIGGKKYCIIEEPEGYFIYVTSISMLQEKILNIITRTDISSPYTLIKSQVTYYRILLLLIIGGCSILLYITSSLLTKPLEQLNDISDRFADGDYSARAVIKSNDEIELLSDKFNHMADSVSSHIDELNDMITRREQFVSDFTHEIKTPMTSIIGYADTLRSKELSRERQIIAANYIFSEGKRLETMSFKLFDLIYLAKHDIEKHSISTEALLQGVAESITPMLKKKNLKLSIDCQNAAIMGDKELLTSALINLADNARKASEPGKEILLKGYEKENDYIIEVKDYGRGMTEEQIKHVCDEFYMADKSRSRKEGGAGLGLSLAAVIFECHDATIHIESALNEGTTISICFSNIRSNP